MDLMTGTLDMTVAVTRFRAPWFSMKKFTLIELLVVVAIIMVLMAMLLPALNGAKDMAKRLACSNSLKQYSLAFFMYVNDHNSYLGGYNTISGTGTFLIPDLFSRLGYLQAKGTKNGNPLLCPASDFQMNSYDGYKFNLGTNWRLETNIIAVTAGDSNVYLCRIEDIKDSLSSTILGLDVKGGFHVTYYDVRPERFSWVHNNGVNVVFCDGHAGWERYGGPIMTHRLFSIASGD